MQLDDKPPRDPPCMYLDVFTLGSQLLRIDENSQEKRTEHSDEFRLQTGLLEEKQLEKHWVLCSDHQASCRSDCYSYLDYCVNCAPQGFWQVRV